MQESNAIGEVFNIGGTKEITILDLALKVKELTGSASEILFIPFDKAYDKNFEDMRQRVPDIEKARRIIGFNPTRSIEDILRAIIDWTKSSET